MSIYQELQSLALNQHDANAVKKINKDHAKLLCNGSLSDLYKAIETDFYAKKHAQQSNYACEVLVTDY